MTARGPRGARFFLRARRSNAPVFRTDAIHSKTPGLRVARSMRAAGTCSSILFWRDFLPLGRFHPSGERANRRGVGRDDFHWLHEGEPFREGSPEGDHWALYRYPQDIRRRH